MNSRARRATILAAVLVTAAALLYWGFAARFAARPAPVANAIPVVVAQAARGEVPVSLSAVGSVQPLNVVNVRARVEGELQKVFFTEGQDMRAGDPLAQIDPRPLQAQLRQSEANLQKDLAQLAHARSELARNIGLAEKGFVSAQAVEAARVQVSSLEATALADRAAMESAQLQLGFTRINSPIAGRVGLRQVDPGSMVRPTDANGLVTVTQMRPIAAVFSIPQDSLPELLARKSQEKLPVAVLTRDGTRHLADGELAFVDSQVDAATGQIKLKAVFANGDGSLWPGEFVSVRLLLRTDRDAIVVPSQAVLAGQDGSYVYVVKANRTAEPRKVSTGASVGDSTAIRSGLQAGEVVVTDGQSRLAPGARVDPRQPPQAAPPGGAAP